MTTESATVKSRRGIARSYADCVSCGERRHGDDKPALARAWARRHAANNPGHQAHVTTETVRVYEVSS